ncbi:MAG: ATP-binding protein, partial [Brevundimonas sp.]|nr:ATP-binding protein [Brevundimonas sp.]
MTTPEAAPRRIPMILTGQALLSLRDSGFSLPTALAEVIDNSIEARAKTIRVRLDEATTKGKKHVHRIAVSDDGDGMDVELLQHYLQVGFSTRYMRTDTIGKYGVGAKLAALNFATRVDVWSRQSSDEPWQLVIFDLNASIEHERKTGESVGVEPPVAAPIPADLADIAPEGAGTLVVWSQVDRLESGRVAADFDGLLVDLRQELSRLFRVFLDGGFELEVNGTKLLPHDPLFLMKGTWAEKVLRKANAARKDGDKLPASAFEPTVLADEKIKVGGSMATLRVTLYPPAVTRKRGLGGDSLAKQLRVPENEGCISFMRLDREIAYNNVPRIFGTSVSPPDRFIGIEVAFKPELDEYFGVRNVKRGVEPHGELREKLRARLSVIVKTARGLLEERWGEVARNDKEHDGEHGPIMGAAAEANKSLPASQGPEITEEEVEQELESLAADTGRSTEDEKKEYVERIRDMPFVIESVDFPGKMFIDVKHLNNQVIIRLNTRHRFYRELWQPLQDIADRDPGAVNGDDAVKAARRAVEGLALMVIAYGKAQSMSVN